MSPADSSFNFGNLPLDRPVHMTAQERREHSRHHSRIHSRNLSVFFPKPGEQFASIPEDDNLPEDDSPVDIPSASLKSWAGASSMGYTRSASQNSLSDSLSSSQSKAAARRGHHHRHTLSHNFSLDPNQLSPGGESSSTGLSPVSPDAPKSVPSSLNLASSITQSSLPLSSTASTLRAKYSHLPTLVRLCLAVGFHLPFSTQIALALSVLEMALGAALWIYGQSGESLAVTGLGYLVVFDGIGALSSVVIEGNAKDVDVLWEVVGPSSHRTGDRQVRYPFGTYRLTTLSQFAQCIYLLFSAVYVCKESIEHVLLLHDPVDELGAAAGGGAGHGSAHGSMGHGEARGSTDVARGVVPEGWVEIGISMPTGLLLLSTVFCLLSAVYLSNHASLTDAVGPTTYALRPRPVISKRDHQSAWSAFLSLLSNPFSLLVLIFAFALSTASITIPAVQLAPLDKVLALLESVAMFYVAYPAAEATGKVLLQTAPPSDARNMSTLMRGIREMETHPLVIYVPQPHIWQLTPHPKADTAKAPMWRSKAASQPQGASILVVTLTIHVKPDALDREVLEVTRLARDKCVPALKGNADFPPGELTVVVRKGMPIEEKGCSHDHGPHHDHGHHGHAHSHDQGHSHSHDHDHGHVHAPSHDPDLHLSHSQEHHHHDEQGHHHHNLPSISIAHEDHGRSHSHARHPYALASSDGYKHH